MVRGPQPCEGNCESVFLGSVGQGGRSNVMRQCSVVQWGSVIQGGYNFLLYSVGRYLAYVKVPRDLSYNVYKPIDTWVQGE